jgi:hypothetical protein
MTRLIALLSCLALVGCGSTPATDQPDADCANPCGSSCCAADQTCKSGVCKTICQPQCKNRHCGSDGCGGSCGDCTGYDTCDEASGTCQPCQPKCGTHKCGGNGCGGTCGTCPTGQSCNAGTCEVCVAKNCSQLGLSCGPASDGCGKPLDCGACASPNTCGGGGVVGVCGCPKTTCVAQGKQCGTAPDGCGGTLSCGACGAGQWCNAGQCDTGQCVPQTDKEFCAAHGANCGSVVDFDNCGTSRTVTCGACQSPQSCGVVTANVCAPDCRLGAACTGQTFCDATTGQCRAGCSSNAQCDPTTETCDLPTHLCVCKAAYHRCGTSCVGLDNPAACGTSCQQCPGTSHGSATCADQQCGLQCESGFILCNGVCLACADAHGTASCVNSSCSISCGSGYHLCGGKCASDTDANACGASCQVCPGGPNGAPVCSGGSCALGCNNGFVKCNGSCIACADPNGTASCVANACHIQCSSGYHLCGTKCAADTDANACGASCQVCAAPPTGNLVPACDQGACSVACKSGTKVCHGTCQSGSCGAWTEHASTDAASYLGIDVDGNGTIHVVTVKDYIPRYYQITGPGVPAAEATTTESICFEDSSYSVDSAPIVFADGLGKVTFACVRGNMVGGMSWSGSAWEENDASSSTSLNDAPYLLFKQGRNRLGFAKYDAPDNETYLIIDELTSQQWDNAFATSIYLYQANVSLLSVLGGAPGAAQLAWVTGDATATLNVGVQGSSGSPATYPNVAAIYALDSSGRIVGVDTQLKYYTWDGTAWQSQSINSATATALDMVVDANGVVRVAWTTGGALRLATKLGNGWTVETIASGSYYSPDLEVGPTGKVAVGAVTGGFSVFE